MRRRLVDPEGNCIDYRLSLLGVRVTAHYCQLIARSAATGRWEPLGPTWPLPIEVPADSASLKAALNNALFLTAWQYDLEFPGSDIREVLSQRKDFWVALNSPEGGR
jgi:hypothetical protein